MSHVHRVLCPQLWVEFYRITGGQAREECEDRWAAVLKKVKSCIDPDDPTSDAADDSGVTGW